jgi:hypothetical protein
VATNCCHFGSRHKPLARASLQSQTCLGPKATAVPRRWNSCHFFRCTLFHSLRSVLRFGSFANLEDQKKHVVTSIALHPRHSHVQTELRVVQKRPLSSTSKTTSNAEAPLNKAAAISLRAGGDRSTYRLHHQLVAETCCLHPDSQVISRKASLS